MSASSDEIEEPTAPFWMTTFSDMVTLLLTFFVMIVSMSEVEVKKFQDALSYFQGRTGMLTNDSVVQHRGTPTTGRGTTISQTTSDRPSPGSPEALQLQAYDRAEQARRYEELLEYIREQGLGGQVQVNLTEEGLHFVLNDAVMFRPGEANLVEPSRTLLALISTLLTPDVQQIVVEGHTDDRPISTMRFPSNWELSTARSASVVRHFLDQTGALPAGRYMSVGKGEFHPVTTNETEEGRSQNRRVEIFFLWTSWQNKTQPTRP